MHYIKNYTSLLLFISCFIINAQNNFQNFGESAFALNHSVSQKYKVNFALRSRYYLFKKGSILYKQRQIDIFHFSTYKLNYHHDLSLGIYYGSRGFFDEGSNEYRITQQFNYKHQKLSIRYGHRFRAEQRILETRTIFRQRYRFSVDFPLNGEKLNIGESYLVATAEGLLNLGKNRKPEIDQRTTLQIGFQVSENLKLQTGLDCRLEAINIRTNKLLFLLTTAILKI
jgi:hypothetical protein